MIAAAAARLRRLLATLRGHACPICLSRFQPEGLAQHLAADHTDAELRRYLREVNR